MQPVSLGGAFLFGLCCLVVPVLTIAVTLVIVLGNRRHKAVQNDREPAPTERRPARAARRAAATA
jgi:hypothetical protein